MANDDGRSDERIRDDVRAVLEQHPYARGDDIEMQVEEGVVVLSGTVRDRRTKKTVQEAIEELPGVRDVENQIRVSQGRLDESLDGRKGR
jgi:osmotically-inducible protein OsmY